MMHAKIFPTQEKVKQAMTQGIPSTEASTGGASRVGFFVSLFFLVSPSGNIPNSDGRFVFLPFLKIFYTYRRHEIMWGHLGRR